MKLGMAICLCLGVASPLSGQQTLLASRPSRPMAFAAAPRASANLAETGVIVGLSPQSWLYDAAAFNGNGASAVCTQAMPLAVSTPSSDYAFDRAQFSAAALKATFSHDNMVKIARNFVPGQPLPDAPSYVALTKRQKFEAFVRNGSSVSLGASILSDALISQATGAYPRLGGGLAGFGLRLGVSASGNEAAAFFAGFVYPTLFHQDARYFPSRQNGIGNRLAYAASRVMIGRSDDGRNVLNTSVIASQFTEAAIANAYVPYRNQSVRGTLENALTGLAGVAEGEILNEFWPDIEQFVFRRTHNSLVRRGLELGGPTPQQGYR